MQDGPQEQRGDPNCLAELPNISGAKSASTSAASDLTSSVSSGSIITSKMVRLSNQLEALRIAGSTHEAAGESSSKGKRSMVEALITSSKLRRLNACEAISPPSSSKVSSSCVERLRKARMVKAGAGSCSGNASTASTALDSHASTMEIPQYVPGCQV